MKEKSNSSAKYVIMIFFQAINLKNHIDAVHEERKPFKCEFCDYSCTHPSSLKKHISNIHGPKSVFKCRLCNKKFGSKQGMNNHIKNFHRILS